MSLAVITHLAMFPIYTALMFYFSRRIIDQIEDSALLARGRAGQPGRGDLGEDEQVGAITVYEDNAILELIDGTVVVIPRMDEAHE